MQALLSGICILVAAVWGWGVAQTVYPASAHPWWIARQETLYLSGLLSIALMSLSMLLATRPRWLERPLGGMDRVYRTHRWAGILGVTFAALHWLIKLSGDTLKSMIGREGRLPKERLEGFLEILRDLAKDLGEWAIYLLLAMLVITLWKRFPYRPWRFLHRIMPVLYLGLVFHSIFLVPQAYWQKPVGGLLVVCLMFGVYGAWRTLTGGIGRQYRHAGHVVAVECPTSDVTTVQCRMGPDWPGHRAGQFAFVTFDEREGGHPFTIASARHEDGTLCFQIKALGDYTSTLAQRLYVGQPVAVEGPYGCFDFKRSRLHERQIWIAGGVGATPFIAWLESLQKTPENAPAAELHYCTRGSAGDTFVAHLQSLCAQLPSIRLQVHDAAKGEHLQADALGDVQASEIWFCGPMGLAKALRKRFRRLGARPRFHQEAFEMR